MYHIIISNTVKKDIKKLSRQSQKILLNDIFPLLEKNPRINSERLTGKYSSLWKHKFNVSTVSYRVVYDISDQQLIIALIVVGTRENIYKELSRRK